MIKKIEFVELPINGIVQTESENLLYLVPIISAIDGKTSKNIVCTVSENMPKEKIILGLILAGFAPSHTPILLDNNFFLQELPF